MAEARTSLDVLQQRLETSGYRPQPGSALSPVTLRKELTVRVPGRLTSVDVVLSSDDGGMVDVYEFVGRRLVHNHTRFDRVTAGNVTPVEWYIGALEEQERF